jgi:hypothetical protein
MQPFCQGQKHLFERETGISAIAFDAVTQTCLGHTPDLEKEKPSFGPCSGPAVAQRSPGRDRQQSEPCERSTDCSFVAHLLIGFPLDDGRK